MRITAYFARLNRKLFKTRIDSKYWIKAYIDANTNGVPDEWEPMDAYPLNPLYLVIFKDDVNVTRTEAMASDVLPLWWVMKNSGSSGETNIIANADNDGYGMSNAREYLAGTDPNNINSVFKADVDAKPSGTGIVLKWNSAYSGQRFGVWRCSDLMTGFTLIQGGIEGILPENTFEDTTATGEGQYYYKITVEQ